MYKTKKCDTLQVDIWFLFLNNLDASHTSHNFHRKGEDDREHGRPVFHCRGMESGKDIQQ